MINPRSLFSRAIDATPAEEERFNNATLNSMMLVNFLLGIYTTVYIGTMYLYLTKRGSASRRKTVVTSITLLYLLCSSFLGIQWYFMNWSMIDNGATRASIFTASIIPPPWTNLASLILQYLMTIVSDGLLVWRCFHLWERSWSMIAFPSFLILIEIGMIVPGVYFESKPHTHAGLINILLACTYFISAGATVLTTALIGFKVYVTSKSTGSGPKRRFRHIFHVLLESAAVYSLVTVCNAVLAVIPSATSANSVTVIVQDYLTLLLPIAAGMAPTILVARIITADSEDPRTVMATTPRISGLKFQGGNDTGQDVSEDTVSWSHSLRTPDFEMGDIESNVLDDTKRTGRRY